MELSPSLVFADCLHDELGLCPQHLPVQISMNSSPPLVGPIKSITVKLKKKKSMFLFHVFCLMIRYYRHMDGGSFLPGLASLVANIISVLLPHTIF